MNDNSGRALVPNRRAPQGPTNVGGISLPTGTGTSLTGTGTGTGTGIGGTGTGIGTGVSTTTGLGSGSGPTTSPPTTSPTTSPTPTSDPVTTTSSPTSPTTTVPSSPITSSSTTTPSTTTTSNTKTSTSGSLTSPPLSSTDSRHPLITSTIWSTFVSTLPDGEVQSFTTPIPTALVSSTSNPSSMNLTTKIVASTVSAFAFLVLLVLAALFIWRRKGLRTRREQQEREKGKEMRRLLEDEDFAVDDEDRWSRLGQNMNFAPSLNSGFGGSLRQISPLRDPIPSMGSEISAQLPFVSQTFTHARTTSTSTTSSSSSASPPGPRPSSSNSTLLPPPSLPDTPRGHSQGRSSLQLTPVPSGSSSAWISRPISATLPPYRDPFGVGPPPPPATLSGISPKLPVTTQFPLSPPPKSFVASYHPQSPGEWIRSPKSPTFAQEAAITMTTVDTPTSAATTTSIRPSLHKKQSTADSTHSVADSVSEYSQESAPLHILSSRLAGGSGEPPPPVPPIPLMPFRPG